MPKIYSIDILPSNILSKFRSSILGSAGTKKPNSYTLECKISKDDIRNFHLADWEIPADATKFSYARLVHNSDKNIIKETISFFDKTGKIIESGLRQNGENVSRRIFEYFDKIRTTTTQIFSNYNLPNNIRNTLVTLKNHDGFWKTTSTEIMEINKFFNFINKQNTITGHSKRIEFINEGSKQIQNLTFTIFPSKGVPYRQNKKQVLTGTLTKNNNTVSLSNVSKSDNLNLDLEDEFLLYRFLDPRTKDGQIYISKDLIKKKGISKLKLNIFPNSNNVSTNSSGQFSLENRSIEYSPNLQTTTSEKAIGVIAHEIEHAYQYSLIGRIGKGHTSYETDALQKYGFLGGYENIVKANKYAIARDNYPRLKDNEDLSKNPKYLNNLLEKDAEKAAKEIIQKYKKNITNYNFFEMFFTPKNSSTQTIIRN